MMQAAIGVVFHEATRRMVNAFERRAHLIYGPRPAPAARPSAVAAKD